jgi:hypothetical protein
VALQCLRPRLVSPETNARLPKKRSGKAGKRGRERARTVRSGTVQSQDRTVAEMIARGCCAISRTWGQLGHVDLV